MLTLFYVPVVSIRLYELAWHSNGSVKCETLECHSNSKHNNLTTFEC